MSLWVPPLRSRDHPWAPEVKTRGVPLPSGAGRGVCLGRKVPGGSGSGGTGLLSGHCTSFLPMPAAAALPPSCLSLPGLCAQTPHASFLFCPHPAALRRLPLRPRQHHGPHGPHACPASRPKEPPAPATRSPARCSDRAVPGVSGASIAGHGAGEVRVCARLCL